MLITVYCTWRARRSSRVNIYARAKLSRSVLQCLLEITEAESGTRYCGLNNCIFTSNKMCKVLWVKQMGDLVYGLIK
ncbi:unnamed protein product [Trichogramma brassicae]|uniref:Uncharacterized protein n=1 Tax=Trichogramma brassicae TaxID=86971 RepID=A0A6H5IVH4_9HYME|nr:unnamed protein product [Trichogramma brassicae]